MASAKAKSNALMNEIKALHANLDQISHCYNAKEAMFASPAMKACASRGDVMGLEVEFTTIESDHCTVLCATTGKLERKSTK